MRITKNTDKPRQKTVRMDRYHDSQTSRPGLIARPLRFSLALSYFLLKTYCKSSFEDCNSLKFTAQNLAKSSSQILLRALKNRYSIACFKKIQRRSNRESSSPRLRVDGFLRRRSYKNREEIFAFPKSDLGKTRVKLFWFVSYARLWLALVIQEGTVTSWKRLRKECIRWERKRSGEGNALINVMPAGVGGGRQGMGWRFDCPCWPYIW